MTRINIKALPANKPQGSIDVIDLGLPSALRNLLGPPAPPAGGPRRSLVPNPRLYPGPEVSKKGRRPSRHLKTSPPGSLGHRIEHRSPEAKSPVPQQSKGRRGPRPQRRAPASLLREGPYPSPQRSRSVPPSRRRRHRARRHHPPRVSPRLYRPPPPRPRRPPPAARSVPKPWAPPPPVAPAHTASDFVILFAEARLSKATAANRPERRAPLTKPAAVTLGGVSRRAQPTQPLYTPQSLHFRLPQRPLSDFSEAAPQPSPPPPPPPPPPPRHWHRPRCAMATSLLDDSSDGNDTLSAPSEFLAEFLSAIMGRRYVAALRYCRLILQYEPHNPTARSFFPLLLQKTQSPRFPTPTPSRSHSSGSSSSSASVQSLSLDSSPRGSGRSSPASPAVDLISSPYSKTDTNNYMPTFSLDDDGDTDTDTENVDLLMEAEGAPAPLRARCACCAIK